MWFWWFMVCCDVCVPVAMIIGGRMMWKHPPKTVNGLVGYRTTRSMKNTDTWNFANTHCGRLWWKIGWLMLLPSVLVHIPVYGKTDTAISTVGLVVMTVQIIVLVGSIFPTERALKRTFTDDGIRKTNVNRKEDPPMLEATDKIGYAEWDRPEFAIPKEFCLNENSRLHEAIEVFYMAGGYDFFRVVDPEKYAYNWLNFIGNLYSDIESGKYKSDGKQHGIPLTEEQKAVLVRQGVPEVFTHGIE